MDEAQQSLRANADISLDLIGLKCPLPVLKLRKAVKGKMQNSSIYVESSDPLAQIDIPHFCQEAGHQLLESGVGENDISYFLIKLT